jgi:hypothetical protein
MVGVKFAYATNGHEIVEFDYATGVGQVVPGYPDAGRVWQGYRDANGLRDQTAADLLYTGDEVLGSCRRRGAACPDLTEASSVKIHLECQIKDRREKEIQSFVCLNSSVSLEPDGAFSTRYLPVASIPQ